MVLKFQTPIGTKCWDTWHTWACFYQDETRISKRYIWLMEWTHMDPNEQQPAHHTSLNHEEKSLPIERHPHSLIEEPQAKAIEWYHLHNGVTLSLISGKAYTNSGFIICGLLMDDSCKYPKARNNNIYLNAKYYLRKKAERLIIIYIIVYAHINIYLKHLYSQRVSRKKWQASAFSPCRNLLHIKLWHRHDK